MKYYPSVFLGAVLSLVLITSAHAAITINEVAWMGNAASQYSEWIELYNSGSESVSLKDWKLYKTGDTLLFTLTKTIAANHYLLIERTTASAPDAVAGINDESGTFGGGGLRNSGEDLILKDAGGNTIDTTLFAGGWPAGDAKTKETMQKNGNTWITALATPDAANATVDDKADVSAESDIHIQSPATPVAHVSPPIIVAPVPTPTSPLPTAVPTPDVIAPPTPVINEPVAAAAVPVIAPIATISKPVVTTVVSKKRTVTAVSKKVPVVVADNSFNDTAADQLQADASVPKENNHIKIIILGAVALIGIALFLLLGRFKASQE